MRGLKDDPDWRGTILRGVRRMRGGLEQVTANPLRVCAELFVNTVLDDWGHNGGPREQRRVTDLLTELLEGVQATEIDRLR